MYIRNIII